MQDNDIYVYNYSRIYTVLINNQILLIEPMYQSLVKEPYVLYINKFIILLH